MELCQAEALCIFHHHNGCIGYIHPHFHNRSRYQNINIAGTEFLHHAVLIRRFHFPVQRGNPNRFRELTSQFLCIIIHVFQAFQFAFFHHGTNHIYLMPLGNLFLHKLICILPKRFIHHTVFNRFTSHRHLMNHRKVHISIKDHGQGTRNRRCTHNQNMGSQSFVRKMHSLFHPKSVLFVSYYQCQFLKSHRFLNQCMGSHHHLTGAFFYLPVYFFFIFSSYRACQQTDIQTKLIGFIHLTEILKMLSSQHLCRCHNGTLISVGGCQQHGQESQNGFTGTHISLHQTAHGIWTGHVCYDFRIYLQLILRQPIGQLFHQALHLSGFHHGKCIIHLL